MSVKWFGKEVTARVRAAQIEGINITMSKAVTHAKRNHTWRNRSVALEGSIAIAEPAAATASGARGVWGSGMWLMRGYTNWVASSSLSGPRPCFSGGVMAGSSWPSR
ncbi:MAG: hypothetical protein R3D34_06845 [Nitratireductor sp.]